MKKMRLTEIFSILLVFILFAFLILSPSEARAAALGGYDLWLFNLLPSLFPFFVLTGYLNRTGAAERLAPLFSGYMTTIFGISGICALPYVGALLSGHTVGARMTCELYSSGKITQKEAQILLALTSSASPVFIFSTVGTVFFGSGKIGAILLAINYASAFLTALLISFRHEMIPMMKPGHYALAKNTDSKIKAFSLSVTDSVLAILNVGGFVVFFQVVIALADHIFHLSGSWGGAGMQAVLELAAGCRAFAALAGENISSAIIAASAAVGFGGLSILFQCLTFITQTDIPAGIYIRNKLLQTAVALTLGIAGCIFVPKDITVFQDGTASRTPADGAVYGLLLFCTFAVIIGGAWMTLKTLRETTNSRNR